MITIEASGDLRKTENFLASLSKMQIASFLERYADLGVRALAAATPFDSGMTAVSWDYEIKVSNKTVELIWTNSYVVNGVPIAIILQYGHGTGTGGYVAGRDYINPALKPIFDKIADDVWKAVTSA